MKYEPHLTTKALLQFLHHKGHLNRVFSISVQIIDDFPTEIVLRSGTKLSQRT